MAPNYFQANAADGNSIYASLLITFATRRRLRLLSLALWWRLQQISPTFYKFKKIHRKNQQTTKHAKMPSTERVSTV